MVLIDKVYFNNAVLNNPDKLLFGDKVNCICVITECTFLTIKLLITGISKQLKTILTKFSF